MHKIIAFVLAEMPKVVRSGGEMTEAKPLQSAPHYFSAAVPRQVIIEKEGNFLIKAYSPNILLVETTVEVESVFSDEAFELREKLIDDCQKIIKKRGGNFELSEEYAVAVVSHYEGDPEQYLQFSSRITSFLKSEKLPLDEHEIQYTLSTQLKYAKDDLVIVDWDGAFIFEPRGEIDAMIELFQIVNLQLLRHRMLDSELDQRLIKVNKMIQGEAIHRVYSSNKELAKAFKEVITLRTKSIGEFDALERDIKLIGDWYSARLYDFAAKKLKIGEWRQSIKEKLDSLEDIYSIIVEKFTVSKLHSLEIIQIVLFFILQAGWFALIILEFLYFTR